MDQYYVYATAAVIVTLVLSRVFRPGFDPFAPIWLFLAGYMQVYVFQALSYRDYALRVRGIDVTTAANARALWALLWFLLVYYSGLGKLIARWLPRAPRAWSSGAVLTLAPLLMVWGMASALLVLLRWSQADPVTLTAGQRLLFQFPTVQLVAGILLIVTGRQPDRPRPWLTAAGLATALSYTLIWMFFGRRSHSLFGVLTAMCAFYLPRYKRPSLATIGGLGFVGCLVVALALGWRNYNHRHAEEGFHGPGEFVQFITEFDVSSILVSLNLKDPPNKEGLATKEALSRETVEYGGFLLMMDTVPHKASYDYGASYIRLVSTYIPRVIWRNKPYYGREKWVAAWIAGSEFPRDESFTGPAIGILGATQLNGGATGTLIVIGVVSLLIRTGYDYFRYHADTPWAQAWWALTYYNAWLMTVNDDPFVWFYYLYGHTTLPPLLFLWLYNRMAAPAGIGAR